MPLPAAPVIQSLNRLVSFTKEEEQIIDDSFELKRFDKKEYLLENGSISGNEYFLLSGCTRTFILDENGREHTLAFSVENWWCGDLKSFIRCEPANYYIQALENTEALSISIANWRSLFHQIPQLDKAFKEIFQNALIARQERLIDNISLNASDRYLKFSEKYPALIERVPQKFIASYLGITPEFLSTIKARIS